MNFGGIPVRSVARLHARPDRQPSLGSSDPRTRLSAGMIEMPAATAAVMACIQAAESRLVIAALAAVGPAWLSVGRAMVKVLARSSLLSGANTRRMRPTVCRPDRDHGLTDGPYGTFMMLSPSWPQSSTIGLPKHKRWRWPRTPASGNPRTDRQGAAIASVNW
jgi:hypothetical protein